MGVDSPILFYTGNEGDIELFAENTGFIWEIAPQLRALIIFAEHRYYGKSLPFGNASFDTPEHLGFLSSEQALADYAALLENINPHFAMHLGSRKRAVIAIGGSYGGMLAAWFRMKYPHMVNGALAASAPIFQVEIPFHIFFGYELYYLFLIFQFGDLTPCSVFTQIVTSVFSTYSQEGQCAINIKHSWDVLS